MSNPLPLADPALARGARLCIQMQALRRLATVLQSPDVQALVGDEAASRAVMDVTQQTLDTLEIVRAWLTAHA